MTGQRHFLGLVEGAVKGVDLSMAMLSYAAKRRVLAIQGIAEALPFKKATFDFARKGNPGLGDKVQLMNRNNFLIKSNKEIK